MSHPQPGSRTGAIARRLLIGLAHGMAAGDGPMTVLGITDPRSWSAADWVADIVPHLAYGATTAAVLDALER